VGTNFRETHVFEGHSGIVANVTFSADGRYVITGATDGEARVWDAKSGLLVWRIFGPAPFTSIALTPDGATLATGNTRGDINFWNVDTQNLLTVACKRVLRDLTQVERRQYGIAQDSTTCASLVGVPQISPNGPPTQSTNPGA
ncbi:MAG TPA: hypothetical protein VKQ72_06250, partial [Aggregatilineales bacterium]|nr:hypothetical protein [Aggregatilineales bacterium]